MVLATNYLISNSCEYKVYFCIILRYTVDMKKITKTILMEAGIKLLSKDEVTQHVPDSVLDAIKEVDPEPMFAMMVAGYEGESDGGLFDSLRSKTRSFTWYKQIWPLKAVKQLVSFMKNRKELPVYDGHGFGDDKSVRYAVGRIVAGVKKNIGGVNHAVAIAYISEMLTRAKIHTGKFDSCSIEATCLFSQAKNKLRWVVEKVTGLSGIALCNSENISPGFKDANILAVVTAMQADIECEEEEDDDNKPSKRSKKVITLKEVKEYISANETSPTALFDIETLTKLQGVKGAFDATHQEETKKLTDNVASLEKELAPFKKDAAGARTKKLIKESSHLADEYDNVVKYIQDTLAIPGIESMDDAEAKTAIDSAVEFNLKTMNSASFKTKNAEKRAKEDESDPDKKSKTDASKGTEMKGPKNEFEEPEKNELIPEGA